MKKGYLIGGLLGAVLCGIVAYAVVTFIEMRNSERAEQAAQELQPPLPLEAALPQAPSPAQDRRSKQGKADKVSSASGLSDSRKRDELKAAGITGVMITLKNGRSILADSCSDVSGKLLCIVSGGSMQIDRQEIASIKDVKLQSISSSDLSGEPSDAKADNGKSADKASAGAKGAETSNGKIGRGLTAGQIKRLDAINERKTLLQPEREMLIKERDQLREDVDNAGVMWYPQKLHATKTRIADLESRISIFNEEVKKLNEEEQKILAPPSP